MASKKKRMGVNISHVARMAGVSESTVSRALSGKGRISAATREKVLAAAAKVNYHPSMAARVLASDRTENVAVIFNKRLDPLGLDPFYSYVMQGVEEVLSRRGYRVFFSTLGGREEAVDLITKMINERRVDGLIMAGADVDKEAIQTALKHGLPVVLVDNALDKPCVDSVMTDNLGGTREAMAYLVKLGHTSIGYIGGPLSHVSLYERYHGYRTFLSEAGLKEFEANQLEVYERFGPEHGYACAMKMIQAGSLPTAVFAANDSLAMGALRAFKENGLRVPRDISIVGFDDAEFAAHTDPPLTTVRVFKNEMGSVAAQRLLDLIDGINVMPMKITIATDLVVRASTGPPKRK